MSLDFNRVLSGIDKPGKNARRDPCDLLDEPMTDPIFQQRQAVQPSRYDPHPDDHFDPASGDGR